MYRETICLIFAVAFVLTVWADPASAQGTSVEFVMLDTETQGNWKGVYGKDGFNIILDTEAYPSYAEVTPAGHDSWTWEASTDDVRAPEKAAGGDRLAACWFSGSPWTIDINLTGALRRQVAIYFLDWDSTIRQTRVEVTDAATGEVLDSQEMTDYNAGKYLVWVIKGHVVINVIHVGGANSVISGLFFDPGPVASSEPDPIDTAIDVPRDVVLEWMPGDLAVTHDVYLGTVFDDVNDASRTDPRSVLVSQGQTDTTYDPPGVLDFSQTYYWRVDEVNGAPDYTVFKGDVWSFTAELFAYPIEGIVATSNMTAAGADQGPENTVNGSGLNENGEHSTDVADMWLASSGGEEPMYIQFEFDRIHKMHAMDVWNHNFIFEMALGFGIKDVTVQYSADGAEWTTLTDVELARAPGAATYTANTSMPLDGVAAKFVRLLVNSNYGGGTQYGLSEVRFLSIPVHPSEPDPADGAADVAVAGPLSWRPGREAASHEVHLGTDPAALSMVGTTTQSTYDAALDLETDYAWQVVEVNNAEAIATWAGPVWSFSTQQYLMVDDFETYTDDVEAGETIWQTWIDGIDDPGNGGSTVGYAVSPFAEQTIVYSGAQSMPLAYDNTGAAYSETTRTFAGPQDWSGHGITTLSVRFKGALTHAATDKLYVKVNGAKATYDGDLTAPIFLPFNVDLTALGVNLGSVNTLTIGVDGTSAGMLFVDTIALYRIAPPEPPAGADKSLVAHWTLDETEGLDVADSSPYGHDGVLIGMTGEEWTAGLRDGALEFAGTSASPQYVHFGSPKGLELSGSVTISAWVKMNEANDGLYMGIAGKLNTDPYAGFALVRHSSNVFRLWADNGAGVIGGFEASSDETYTDTEWHHVAGVVDDGTSMLYVDEVKQTQENAVDLTSSPGYAYIGKQYNSETVHRYWNGLVDDVRIYYRALSAQEIAGL